MSQNYNGRDMEGQRPIPGSVRRARERAQAGLPRDASAQRPAHQGNARQLTPAAKPSKLTKRLSRQLEGTRATANDRTVDVPQWPLPGPSVPLNIANSKSTSPNVSRSQPEPKRQPRSAHDSSVSDMSESPTTFFLGRSSFPDSPQDSFDAYNVMSPGEASRRTVSSAGSIPDFPIPAASVPSMPPRKSTILGPPPSSRRGLSTMYSNASLVSPIPEESPRYRLRGSYASSAAMPETWGTSSSPMGSPGYSDAFFDDSATDRSRDSTLEDFEDEERLVSSSNIGANGKSGLVTATSISDLKAGFKPKEKQLPIDVSANSITAFPMTGPMRAVTPPSRTGLTPDAILQAYAAASVADATDSRPGTGSQTYPFPGLPPPSRFGADSARTVQERGSLTSLPDMIRRATRLASMIEKGKRPGSRLGELNQWPAERLASRDGEASLSDMLAAFPPPVNSPRNLSTATGRGSWARSVSWPMQTDETPPPSRERSLSTQSVTAVKKRPRRCCGLPPWALVLLIILLLCIVAAAIVVPLEFFVFKNLGNKSSPEASIENCREALQCLNGGINVISAGTCSCICTNGFTGSNCGTAGAQGCTTTNMVAKNPADSINNATLGRFIPRLIEGAATNFSVPISGTALLAQLNSGSLSCNAQNSLVTFEGRSARAASGPDGTAVVGSLRASLQQNSKGEKANQYQDYDEYVPRIPTIILIPPPRTITETTFVELTTTTVTPSKTPATERPTFTAPVPLPPASGTSAVPTLPRTGAPPKITPTVAPAPATSVPPVNPPTPIPTAPLPSTPAPSVPVPDGSFLLTEDALDFARVAVLFITQDQGVSAGETAQTALRRLFSRASKGAMQAGNLVTPQEASQINVGGSNRVNLVAFNVDIGKGPVGRKNF
ncbi:hypothetical protein HIM_04792 [Hirsutella minnesotensis 3608]|uniref:EGF-like domain-containing protein n=1 Tax=Hirsutella minnesotensis 3608 TaxID=1043627 RepID=A0A0F7ZV44_9HYPO|nr:hypothetical protein HIM_04792 [Hirsutella minnesotensis 3608]